MRVIELMSERVKSAAPDEPAELAWERMRRDRIHHLVVMKDGKVIGILSDRDLGGAKGASQRRGRSVGELMSAPVATVGPNATLRQAANLLRGRSIGCLPVLDGQRLVGILTVTDILELLGRGAQRLPTPGTRWKPIRRLTKAPRTPPMTARH